MHESPNGWVVKPRVGGCERASLSPYRPVFPFFHYLFTQGK